MKINNTEVIQSYILTTAKYDYSIYEKRILYKLIESLQFLIEGKSLKGNAYIQMDLFEEHDVKMSISSFLASEKDNNYERVKKALKNLETKSFEYEDEKVWQLIKIIERPVILKHEGYVTFRLHPKIFEALFNFSKGYRKYELKTAMMLNSIYSMRLYELLSGQKTPLTYKIEHLKIMLKVRNKYKLTADFIRYIIDISKKELDKKCPYSFDYKPNKIGKKIDSITFYPIYKPENRDPELERKDLQKQVSLRWDFDKTLIDYLEVNFGFTQQEIKNNFKLFKEAQQSIDLLYFLSEIKVKAQNARTTPQAFVIGALRKQLGISSSKKRTSNEK